MWIAENAIRFKCPGCQEWHTVPVHGQRLPNGAGWTFNGNMDSPALSLSIRVRWTWMKDPHFVESEEFKDIECHSLVTDGQIEYYTDSTHGLAGQTVPLPEL